MPRTQQTAAHTLHDLDHIPVFGSEAEEAAYWDDHDLGEDVLERMEPLPEDVLPPARPRAMAITLRLDAETLHRLRSLAARRHVGYRTLIERFITERLAEEERRRDTREGHDGHDQ